MTDYALRYALSGGTWVAEIIPSTVKTASVTASGNTALWTPATGKRFRLMRLMAIVTSDAATSGGARVTVDLKDGASTSTGMTFDVYCPAVAGSAFGNGFFTGWVDLGQGVLSSAANNVLNINLSAALSSGVCRVVACGSEE